MHRSGSDTFANRTDMNGMMVERLNRCIRDEPITSLYTIEQEIGRGKFAVVRRIRDKNTGKVYAAKFIRKRRKGKDCRNDVLHELVMHEIALSHPRLIHMTDIHETVHEIVVIMEYAAGGELYHQCVIEETITERDSQRMMRQILEAIAFLHAQSIVHLDIKPSNVLLMRPASEGSLEVKLCDFGFARLVNTGLDIREILGTPDYVAPEILSYEPIQETTDMWSVGVLAYVMLTGHAPFQGETKQETFLNISQINYDFPDELFGNISEKSQDFIRRLLQKEPEDRPSARECLNHPWLELKDAPVIDIKDTAVLGIKGTSVPIVPGKSPLSCRRQVPDIIEEEIAPSKKYKLTSDSNASNSGSLKENQSEVC
ncbi:serine/threonine-protein kinase 17A-like [Lineus longissimus]|uniref:serine/threonine-protein kinase 17A-like n=1 Tax=Lineus longissimus TaxID=88925 RepID=UPI002B4EF927